MGFFYSLATDAALRFERHPPPRPPLTLTLRPFAQGICSKVIDGDTLDVEAGPRRLRVRLAGIDNPELCHPHKPTDPRALACKGALARLIRGRRLLLLADPGQPPLDNYGRHVAHALRADTLSDIGWLMILTGYAYPHPRCHGALRAPYVEAFKWARDAGLGVLSGREVRT